MPDCGLLAHFADGGFRCDRSPTVDLESISANVVIHGFVANLTVELLYRNNYGNVVEVSYLCPVDAKAAIYHFEASLDGRIIRAHCLEKTKAKKTYEDAVNQGNTAILGFEDEFSGDLLHLSLGNLPSGEAAKLSLKMVMELTLNTDGGLTFTLPTVFNPRYCPSDQQAGPEQFRSKLHQSVTPSRSPYTLDVKGEVRGSLKIAKVTSEKSPINVQICDDETTAVVTQDGGSSRDHDWSFKVYYQTVHQPQALQMPGDRSSTGLMKDDVLMLNIFPEVPVEGFSPHNELIFIVDRSGSMHGTNIEHAKNTLLLFLKSLPSGCRFNIISFGNYFSSLFKSSSERYTENTLNAALQLQRMMEADMGGTEIMAPLKSVYSKDLIPGYARQVIVLTDGAVWNQEQIFELVARNAIDTRVFAVGIGEGASTALVQGIADAGRGRYEMVSDNSQLQMKVMGLVASMLQDNVTDLKVDIEAEPPQVVSLVPKLPPVVFGGQHLILYARIQPKTKVKSVEISGHLPAKGISCKVAVNGSKVVHDSNFAFHRLAAKAQLKQWGLEDAEENADKMIAFSISSNVVCKVTALVGIDQEGRKRSIPFGKCTLRGGGFRACNTFSGLNTSKTKRAKIKSKKGLFGSFGLCSASPPASALVGNSSSMCFGGFAASPPSRNIRYFAQSNSSAEVLSCDTTDSSTSEDEKMTDKPQDIFLTIVSAQNFDGSWDPELWEELLPASSKKLKELQTKMNLDEKCFTTVIVLAYLEIKLASRKREWQLLFIKGKTFLSSKSLDATLLIEQCSEPIRSLLEALTPVLNS